MKERETQDPGIEAYSLFSISQVLRLACVCGTFVFPLVLFSMPCSLAQPAFDANRAFKYLQTQCDFGPRPPSSAAHKQTRDYLISELGKFAREVTAQDFIHQIPGGSLELTNIIGLFGSAEAVPGINPTKKILLAAHWDTRPFADQDPDPEKRHLPILGANDGASGVAVLLELARTFHVKPPNIKVIMVLFDGEDYGKTSDEMLLGSRYFASNMDDGWRPDYGILIDMIGDKDLDIPVERFSKQAAPDVVKKVWQLARKLRLEGIYPELGTAVLDDHIPLIQAGIKCIDIIDFNYPYWHSVEDTPDKCSPKSLETIGKLLLELIYSE